MRGFGMRGFGLRGVAAPAAQHSQQPAAAAALRSPRRARRSHGPCPARRRGFPTSAARMAGAPARNPSRLPPNATMARDSSGQSLCPGPMPWRRHIQAIELPNGPRTDAASACAEPAGRSGRSCHHDGSRPERRRRTACTCCQQEEDQQGEPTDEPLRRLCGRLRTGPICIGGIGFGRSGEWVVHSGRTLRPDGRACQALFPVRGSIAQKCQDRHGSEGRTSHRSSGAPAGSAVSLSMAQLDGAESHDRKINTQQYQPGLALGEAGARVRVLPWTSVQAA